jgi:hypothetical protein
MDETWSFTVPFGHCVPGLWAEGAVIAYLEGMMIVLVEPTDRRTPAMVAVKIIGGERDGPRSVMALRIRVTQAFPCSKREVDAMFTSCHSWPQTHPTVISGAPLSASGPC